MEVFFLDSLFLRIKKREGIRSVSILNPREEAKFQANTSVVSSAQLYWISGDIVTERSKFIELTNSDRSRQMVSVSLCWMFARSKSGWSRARNGSDSFQKCSINNLAQSTVDGGVYGESRIETIARSCNEIDCLFGSGIRYFSCRFFRLRFFTRVHDNQS